MQKLIFQNNILDIFKKNQSILNTISFYTKENALTTDSDATKIRQTKHDN